MLGYKCQKPFKKGPDKVEQEVIEEQDDFLSTGSHKDSVVMVTVKMILKKIE